MRKSRIGSCYTYKYEVDMLEMANSLEAKGFAVERAYDNYFDNFKVTIIGYKKGGQE